MAAAQDFMRTSFRRIARCRAFYVMNDLARQLGCTRAPRLD